ncbi:biopolymer transporter ExbD [Comamonas sp. 26]|uniref:biopolymer transporter ExbD n=1 Tax=Comamonas sp. 26 TaxID=2035201 RepID=UPI000C183D50|nr:biopolymer transporter ExbD [Comamonas sp. 26]PIG08213.1 cell division and transport-associated protein TolR [Comamonas sp. 26]
MAAMSSRGRNRRTVNEINMVPFIDVMLVLLIIFMVTAPMLTPGSINVPSAGKSSRPPTKNIAYVLLDKDGSIQFKNGSSTQSVKLDDLKGLAQSWQESQSEDSAIQIIADKGLPFEDVMKAHTTLSKAGIKRIAFGVVSSSSN